MRNRHRLLLLGIVTCFTASVQAAEQRWSFAFNQGVAEYAVGSFGSGKTHLALSCAEAGLAPGSVSVSLARAGFKPARPTKATFTTDTGKVTLLLDAQGSRDFASLAAAAEFRALWRLLATGRTLSISYGPGKPMTLPLTGAADLLGSTVCPKQLAQ